MDALRARGVGAIRADEATPHVRAVVALVPFPLPLDEPAGAPWRQMVRRCDRFASRRSSSRLEDNLD